MNRKGTPLVLVSLSTPLFGTEQATLMGFITQRPGLEMACCVSHDNVRTPPSSPAAKQKRFQRQSSLPGILLIQTNKQETIIRKTALQLGSPLLEAPQQGWFSAQLIKSVCVAFLENGQWAQRAASATRTGLPPPTPQHTHTQSPLLPL